MARRRRLCQKLPGRAGRASEQVKASWGRCFTSLPSEAGEGRPAGGGGVGLETQIWEGPPDRTAVFTSGRKQRSWLWVCEAQGEGRR